MPKIVDPDRRRANVVDALFRVVRRAGLEGASLRRVADEAGLAVGSVRHYFDGHDALVAFALDAMVERVTARLVERASALVPALERGDLTGAATIDAVVDLLAELLPLDTERRDEAAVWLAFESAARTRPELRERSAAAVAGTSALVRRVLDGAHARGSLRPGLDLDLEEQRLSALVDGLTVRGVLHPELLPPDRARAVLASHLAGLRA
ncbi:TetR/AcrR family transcriptional regulator [Isoptericola cucumis]|uniref:TetR family transcriptional regulator n=1 Tax=Isoptericola cucumis TaxID=1776856 RepID=A0ABQ2BDR3_9MICO|nr:TetR family transcriptional regulator C-terminal domain-containing protein [Isoptericola cucumis]GGI11459.1 TetR family transcriptional regulator [Isoptericola cucumis]